jgi:hypothetical protein
VLQEDYYRKYIYGESNIFMKGIFSANIFVENIFCFLGAEAL